MRIPILFALATLAAAGALSAQQTRAERTDYAETSTHADVLAFVDSLQRLGAGIRVGRLGLSPLGKTLPYVIASRPLVDAPARAARSGKPVLYLQGNIHGGEVEGKEALLMLLRDLTLGPLRPLLDSVVLVVVPIYNADGNDTFGPEARNRPAQKGPPSIGLRANGQGLDLNRDYLKQEAPETRAAASLLNAWDPDIFVDLHTTNGSYHGYLLTYEAGLNPNSNPANDYIRDKFLPEIRTRMRARHKQEVFSYGNFRNADSLEQGWETYDARPRFGTNWIGLRGRMAILSEAYSHADFRTRVSATYNFVLELLRLAAAERTTIKSVNLAASRYRPDSVSLRSTLAPPTPMDVIAELTERAPEGSGPFARRRQTGVFRTIRMPVYGRFRPARQEAFPAAYLFGPQHAEVAALLRSQGIEVRRITVAWSAPTEAFQLDSVVPEPLFEGHRTTRVEGRWGPGPSSAAMPAGWFMVLTDQPLGLFAATLLEPASEDGLVTWNFFDRNLRRGQPAPVLRVRNVPAFPSENLP